MNESKDSERHEKTHILFLTRGMHIWLMNTLRSVLDESANKLERYYTFIV